MPRHSFVAARGLVHGTGKAAQPDSFSPSDRLPTWSNQKA
jgi:hypothetical protein